MSTVMNANAFLSKQQAAELLAVSAVTIGRLIAKGDLEAHRVGKQWRISPEGFAAYLADHMNTPGGAGVTNANDEPAKTG